MPFCLEYNREELQEAEERRVVEFFRLTTLPAIHYKKVCLFLLINIRPVFIIVIYLAIVISYYHIPRPDHSNVYVRTLLYFIEEITGCT